MYFFGTILHSISEEIICRGYWLANLRENYGRKLFKASCNKFLPIPVSINIDDDNERVFRRSSRDKSKYNLANLILAFYMRSDLHVAEITNQRTLDVDRLAHRLEFYNRKCIRRLSQWSQIQIIDSARPLS